METRQPNDLWTRRNLLKTGAAAAVIAVVPFGRPESAGAGQPPAGRGTTTRHRRLGPFTGATSGFRPAARA